MKAYKNIILYKIFLLNKAIYNTMEIIDPMNSQNDRKYLDQNRWLYSEISEFISNME